ncbi:MAG: sigma-54-dependent transcriptional regulator [Candidatus Binatia bacterium]
MTPIQPPIGMSLDVLVIDDEKNIRDTLTMCLEAIGCRVTGVATAEAARAAVASRVYDIALLDLRLGETSGLGLLPELLAARPDLGIVIITAYATIDTAVEAIRRGAWDYLPKPFTPVQVRHVVEQLATRRQLARRLADVEQQLRGAAPEVRFDTAAPAMRAVLDVVPRVAASDATVLLRGENGTGKGVLARRVHEASPRRDRPFVVVNCPTLSEELLASELFGHVRGAFTGAVRDQIGRVGAADGGTLFLDEIGEISPGLQAKLLRFLQDRQFERVGDTVTRSADVRILAATNRALEADVRAGRFREDLLYRLNVLELRVPPLRERREDILPLAEGFLAFFARAAKRPTQTLSPDAAAALRDYPWPGNVRELRNAIERALILWPGQVIEPAALPERIAARSAVAPELGGDYTVEAIEREHILRVIARQPTLDDAARILGIDASTLWRKRRRYEGLSG